METGLTLIDLSNFTGRATTYYERFVTEAIEQATDLFELATALESMPEEGLNLRLAKRAILSMAETLYEGQSVRDLRFSPFRTETIGSYTYSLAEAAVLQGIPTGISWFDLAVSRLKVGVSTIGNTSIKAFDRPGDLEEFEGATYLPGPADSNHYKGSPKVGIGYGFGDQCWSGVDGSGWVVP